MSSKMRRRESGFTVLEVTVVVVVAGAVLAFATPSITNAMRNYRLNVAARQMAGLVHRAKMQAVSENRRSSITVDVDGRRIGLVVYRPDNITVDHVEFVPLPSGIRFEAPPGNQAPIAGAPTDSCVSFPREDGIYNVHRQDFTSRGFPSVAAGTINAVYLTNGNSFRAVTLNSVGAIRTWTLEGSRWVVPHR